MRFLRILAAVISLAALAAAFALPVTQTTALLMAAALLLPLFVIHPIGLALPEDEKTRYVTRQSSAIAADAVIRVVAAIGWLSAASQLGRFGASEPMTFTLLFSVIAFCGLPVRLFERASRTQSLTIDPEAVTVFGPSGARVVRFEELEEIRVERSTLTLVGAEPVAVVVQAMNGRWAAKRIARAIEDARREWRARSRTRPSTVEERLRRGDGQKIAHWLRELDALRVAGGTHGALAYRDDGGLDEEALWQTLEREDAPRDVRAAAARILGRSPPARVRIAECVRVADDDRTRAALEASQKELEDAAAALEAIETEELERDVGR